MKKIIKGIIKLLGLVVCCYIALTTLFLDAVPAIIASTVFGTLVWLLTEDLN